MQSSGDRSHAIGIYICATCDMHCFTVNRLESRDFTKHFISLGSRAWCKCPGSFPKHEHQDGKLKKLAKENYSIVLFTYVLWSFNVGESTIHGSLVISLGTIQWRRCRYIGLFSSLTSDPHPPILPTPAAANKQLLTEIGALNEKLQLNFS